MRTPAQAESFFGVPIQFHLGIHLTSWDTRMLCSVKHHNSSICTHRRDHVRILWLVSGLVDFSLVIDLLDDVEFDLDL